METPADSAVETPITWDQLYIFMDEVKAMAHGLLARERHAESLQTTALVQEALQRQPRSDQDWSEVTWQTRSYFFGAMYRAMRRSLIDHARHRLTQRRASEISMTPEDLQQHLEQGRKRQNFPISALQQLNFQEMFVRGEEERIEVLIEALESLRSDEPQLGKLLEHQFYSNLTLHEIAYEMECSQSTVERHLRKALTMLHLEIIRRLNE
jgi:RNA polymerase sigma-70 factor, ECF subfamily